MFNSILPRILFSLACFALLVALGAAVVHAGQEKVTICHKGKTLEVADPAVASHLAHGDYAGECMGGSTPTPPVTPTQPVSATATLAPTNTPMISPTLVISQ